MINVVPAEISQVFQNLIKNAMDAMHQQDQKEINIESGLNNKFAYFSVSDNGPGIPAEIISRIFDPFFTTKPKENKNGEFMPTGTGIGLRFCKSTIEAYGGNITVDEKKERGACFTVKIPIAQSN